MDNVHPLATLQEWNRHLESIERSVSPVVIRPLYTSDASLLASIGTEDTFEHFITVKPTSKDENGYAHYIEKIRKTSSIFGFMVIDQASGNPLGSTCFLDIRPEDKHVEIGLTWYAEVARGTKVNPASKMALLEIAFDDLGCERVTLKCDSRNQRSRNAIAKLGGVYEGTLRRHKPTGPDSWRDTSYYSILKEEWQGVRERLLARLTG